MSYFRYKCKEFICGQKQQIAVMAIGLQISAKFLHRFVYIPFLNQFGEYFIGPILAIGIRLKPSL